MSLDKNNLHNQQLQDQEEIDQNEQTNQFPSNLNQLNNIYYNNFLKSRNQEKDNELMQNQSSQIQSPSFDHQNYQALQQQQLKQLELLKQQLQILGQGGNEHMNIDELNEKILNELFIQQQQQQYQQQQQQQQFYQEKQKERKNSSIQNLNQKQFEAQESQEVEGEEQQEQIDLNEMENVGLLAEEMDASSVLSEDEGIEDYKPDGYHTVYIGEILNSRYVILQKLGWGHFSTVWLARDIKYSTYVAVKVLKSAQHYLDAAFDEVEILQKAVRESQNREWVNDLHLIYKSDKKEFGVDDCHVVQLLNAFIYQGPYGRHFCMVFEILGVNVLEIIKRYDYRGIPIQICRAMSKQILLGLHYLHKYCGIIHTDLKPENVMVCLNHNELKEIFSTGQLNNKMKIEKRLRGIQNKMKILRGEAVNEADQQIQEEKEIVQEQMLQGSRLSFENNLIMEALEGRTPQRLSFKQQEFVQLQTEGEEKAESQGWVFRTKEEMQVEFERIINEKGNLNNKQKKNLKKKLKRKLKKQEKNQTESEKFNLDKLKSNVPEGKEKTKRADINLLTQSLEFRKKMVMDPLFSKSGLSENFTIKIADLGNGCWVHHHFQPEIQTRQYRSPEVILGIRYNETADIWSFACMLFEMLTGDFLFYPQKAANYSKSTDHLALMMQMLNNFPSSYSTIGTNSKRFIDELGSLFKYPEIIHKSLVDHLIQKYGVYKKQAEQLSDFLLPMLNIFPEKRMTAWEALNHSWLYDPSSDFVDPAFKFQQIAQEQNPGEIQAQNVNDNFFNTIVNKEELNGDESEGVIEDIQSESEMEVQYENEYDQCVKYFDRGFKTVYVGYSTGIDLNSLDNTKNWQFDRKWK